VSEIYEGLGSGRSPFPAFSLKTVERYTISRARTKRETSRTKTRDPRAKCVFRKAFSARSVRSGLVLFKVGNWKLRRRRKGFEKGKSPLCRREGDVLHIVLNIWNKEVEGTISLQRNVLFLIKLKLIR
jgi:hypothetical protein